MNKYIYLLAVVFGLSGCNDFLELSPTNKVIETDYYKTQEDLTEALVAAYDPLKWNAYNAYSSYELVSNIMSDLACILLFPVVAFLWIHTVLRDEFGVG